MALLLACLLASCGSQQTMLTNLRVEYQDCPLSIDSEKPRFSWNYKGNPSFVQKKYELSIGTTKACGDWTTGEITSPSMQAEADIRLKPHSTYYWKVSACDVTSGKKVTSAVHRFETAKMSPSDWTGQWISDGRDKDDTSVPVLRKSFETKSRPVKARLYMSAAAYALMKINGRRIASTSLNPGYTQYDKRNLYDTYDVTSLIRKGNNELVAVLGNGFYNVIEKNAVWDFEKARWRGRPCMVCELRLTYADGSVQTINSDVTWETTTDGPYLRNNIYAGDTYDARKEVLPRAGWQKALAVKPPSSLLKAQQMPKVEVCKVYKPCSVKAYGDSVYVYDFGANMSGFCRLNVKGKAGTRLSVQHGELLKSDGRLEMRNLDIYYFRQPGLECQTDIYYLGEGENILQPEFCYHGFRYVEVKSDSPIRLTEQDAEALFVHTDLKPVGSFECSNDTLNRLWEMINRSYLCNYVSIPTDCPQREKNGWTADAHISSDIGLLNFDGITAYEKWTDDILDNQNASGQITSIIPSGGWGLDVGPVWDAALFIIPMQLYNYYGDAKYVRKVIPACERYLSFLKTRETPEGTINYGLGDWVFYKMQTPNEFTSTCYYYLLNLYLARFKGLAGQDGHQYAEKAAALQQTIRQKFFNAAENLYANGSQAAQALALYLGIVPEQHERYVAANLSRLIHENNNHLDFGMLGSKTVLRMLAKYGYVDQALDMALQKDAPSWADWVEKGYTTPIETWVLSPDFRDASTNHVFLGDINAWMYNCLAGINYDDARPGFVHTRIEPYFPRQLSWVKARYQSPSGEICSEWKRTGGTIRLKVSIPVNTTATIVLKGEKREVGAGNHEFSVQNP